MTTPNTITMYLYFKDTDQWWNAFVEVGFGHIVCAILTKKNCKMALGMEALDSSLQIGQLNTAEMLDTAHAILKITYELPLKRRRLAYYSARWGLFSCVSLVEYILSLHRISWTPYGLYKKLTSKNISKKNPHIKCVEIVKGK
jgi:hypothetical protein